MTLRVRRPVPHSREKQTSADPRSTVLVSMDLCLRPPQAVRGLAEKLAPWERRPATRAERRALPMPRVSNKGEVGRR